MGMSKYMKRLAKILVILCIGLLLPIAFISSYDASSVTTFSGIGHSFGGCHADMVTFSSGGTINIVSSPGNEVNAGEDFTISATISGFTEAASQNVTMGFSSSRGDNDEFEFSPEYAGTVSVDASGDSATKEFTLTAPSEGGTFIIIVDALNDPDTAGGEAIDWTYGSIEITVTGSAGGAGDSDLKMTVLFGTVASIGALVAVSFLSVKFYLERNRKL